MSTQRGTQSLPTSDKNTLNLTFSFPIPYNGTKPQVTATVQGSIGTYKVQDVVITPLQFKFGVTRTDQTNGWTEEPQLEWTAVGREVPPAEGTQVIEKSSSNTADITVKFPSTIDPAPKKIFAWVIGDFFSQITYAVQMGSINSSGFQCTVKRTDTASGWDESPSLFWTIIQK
ncbi:uncharacterized protein LOC143468940 [Clavelina lepadiformis]|uniref:H-type lectin domain-containing protein n=1 Tax=Clavelina lepadiformis TaxID=159417 RepID=A0ABP0F0H7_CLALP